MLWKLKRRCRPTTLMLVLGFAISMTAVLIGISVIHDLLESLASARSGGPDPADHAEQRAFPGAQDLPVFHGELYDSSEFLGNHPASESGGVQGIRLVRCPDHRRCGRRTGGNPVDQPGAGASAHRRAFPPHQRGAVPFTLPPFSWEAPCCSCSLPWRSPRQSRLSAFWESIRRR